MRKAPWLCAVVVPRVGGTRQWEGACCLTAIPALQDLAAHGILGSLGAAQVLAVDPEAGMVLLHQVAVVPNYCGTGGEMCVTQGCVPRSVLPECKWSAALNHFLSAVLLCPDVQVSLSFPLLFQCCGYAVPVPQGRARLGSQI